MEVKENIRNDIEKYGYAFLAFGFQKDPNRISEIAAFTDPAFAFLLASNPEKAKGQGLIINYMPFKEAKKAALSEQITSFAVWKGIERSDILCPDPKDPVFTEFLKSWFNDVKNSQKGDKC